MNPGFTIRNLSTRQLVEELARRKGVKVESAGRGKPVTIPGSVATIILIDQEGK